MPLKTYTFSEKKSHGIDWDSKKVYLIDNEQLLSEIILLSSGWKTIYVDMEGKEFGNRHSAEIGLVQVAVSTDKIFLFDIVNCEENLNFIKNLVQSKRVLKVFHDCSGDISALGVETNVAIKPQQVFDTQAAQQVLDNPDKESYNLEGYSLKDVYKKQLGKEFPQINVNVKHPDGNKWLDERPMTERMIKYAVGDVMFLPEIYCCQQDAIKYSGRENHLRERILNLTEEKIAYKTKFKDNPLPEPEGNGHEIVGQSPLTSSSQRGLEQAESSGLGTALTVAAVTAGVGALAMYWFGRQRNQR